MTKALSHGIEEKLLGARSNVFPKVFSIFHSAHNSAHVILTTWMDFSNMAGDEPLLVLFHFVFFFSFLPRYFLHCVAIKCD